MEEKIRNYNPTLHKYLFTVTTFSKFLAMFLFILLPFVGFYLGMKYQQIVPLNTETISSSAPETKTASKYISYQDIQAPTGDIVYQTEIPSDWTAYTNYTSTSSVYDTNLGPSHYSLSFENSSETTGMITSITIFYSKSSSGLSKIADGSLNTKTVNIDGVVAKQFNLPDQGGMSTNILFTKNNTTFLIAEPNGSGEGSEIFKHIISTFKVIKGQLY